MFAFLPPFNVSSTSLFARSQTLSHNQHGSSISKSSIMCKVGGQEKSSKSKRSISRRQAIQLLNGVLGVTTATLLYKMREQYRLISPQALLSAFGLSRNPLRVASASAAQAQSSEQFKEALDYIAKIDSRNPVLCPDFAKQADWINSRPLSLGKELKGKIVLLDFFTYCCINCQHVLPKLRSLEQKYGEDGTGGVTVVGVHSAKFTAERDTKNIAAAVERYDVKHPVINDERMELWNALGVSSWPTLVLLGPKGNVLAVWSGERQEDDIDLLISAALDYYSADIDHRTLPKAPPRSSSLQKYEGKLRYPGKLALSENGKQLFVSDTGNNRIIQMDTASGKVLSVFGSGEVGFMDSPDGTKAMFNGPQGLVEWNGMLFVADTENHAVRKIDLTSGGVETIGGNGDQGFDYVAGQYGKSQPLSSPWDVEVHDGVLFVAMAGTHQLWSLTLPTNDSSRKFDQPWSVFSGSGRELEKNSADGRLAGWAQPSHLSVSGDGLMFVADSESSSIRAIDTNEGTHPTRTLAGGDGLLAENLFAYGDKDGKGSRARFQHPLAVCFDDQAKLLYVADSYNHRIKTIDGSGEARVFCGTGNPGFMDGSAQKAMFWEPGGLALSSDGSQLFVADTNNFAVRVVDTKTKLVTTMEIASSLPGITQGPNDKALITNRRRAIQISCEPIKTNGIATFTISIPEKSHFTPGTISRYQVNLKSDSKSSSGASEILCLQKGEIKTANKSGIIQIDMSEYSGKVVDGSDIEVEAVTYYCTEDDDVCRMEGDIFDFKLQNTGSEKKDNLHSIKPRKARMTTA